MLGATLCKHIWSTHDMLQRACACVCVCGDLYTLLRKQTQVPKVTSGHALANADVTHHTGTTGSDVATPVLLELAIAGVCLGVTFGTWVACVPASQPARRALKQRSVPAGRAPPPSCHHAVVPAAAAGAQQWRRCRRCSGGRRHRSSRHHRHRRPHHPPSLFPLNQNTPTPPLTAVSLLH